MWLGLVAGAGLWTAAIAIAVQLIWESWLVFGRYRRFLIQLSRTPAGLFNWRTEIWPLQWRIGVQSLVRYLAFLPILPILFDSQGPELAGRYGMTWQVISSLTMVAYVFVRTKSPEFGRLLAEEKRLQARDAFRRATNGSTVLLILLLAAFCIALFALTVPDWATTERIAGRFLSVRICGYFALAMIPMHLTQCYSMLIRSQKMDPIWKVSLPTCAVIAVCAATAAGQGRVEWIAVSILLAFGVSTAALVAMARRYDRHFESQD